MYVYIYYNVGIHICKLFDQNFKPFLYSQKNIDECAFVYMNVWHFKYVCIYVCVCVCVCHSHTVSACMCAWHSYPRLQPLCICLKNNAAHAITLHAHAHTQAHAHALSHTLTLTLGSGSRYYHSIILSMNSLVISFSLRSVCVSEHHGGALFPVFFRCFLSRLSSREMSRSRSQTIYLDTSFRKSPMCLCAPFMTFLRVETSLSKFFSIFKINKDISVRLCDLFLTVMLILMPVIRPSLEY